MYINMKNKEWMYRLKNRFVVIVFLQAEAYTRKQLTTMKKRMIENQNQDSKISKRSKAIIRG